MNTQLAASPKKASRTHPFHTSSVEKWNCNKFLQDHRISKVRRDLQDHWGQPQPIPPCHLTVSQLRHNSMPHLCGSWRWFPEHGCNQIDQGNETISAAEPYFWAHLSGFLTHTEGSGTHPTVTNPQRQDEGAQGHSNSQCESAKCKAIKKILVGI